MYIPESFREKDLSSLHDVVRSRPLGTLISGRASELSASLIPFLIYPGEGRFGILRAHLARANPHAKQLANDPECLILFQAEAGYITPSWYPSKQMSHKVVPTWNYAVVEIRGRASVIEDPDWLHRQVSDVTNFLESRRLQPWQVSDAPAEFIASQLKAIVGIEIPITSIEGKWKMSQNRSDADRDGVIKGLSSPSDPHADLDLARLVASRVRD